MKNAGASGEEKEYGKELYETFHDNAESDAIDWNAPDPLPGDELNKAKKAFGFDKIVSNNLIGPLVEDEEYAEQEVDEDEDNENNNANANENENEDADEDESVHSKEEPAKKKSRKE